SDRAEHSRSARPGHLLRLRLHEAAGLKSPARPFATEGCRPTVFGGSRPAFLRMSLDRTHTGARTCGRDRVLMPEDRGRDAHYCTPPAQIRTSPIRASGSYLARSGRT